MRKYAIADGAYLLESAVPYLPVGVHVGVVDPGVGTPRLPIAVRATRAFDAEEAGLVLRELHHPSIVRLGDLIDRGDIRMVER